MFSRVLCLVLTNGSIATNKYTKHIFDQQHGPIAHTLTVLFALNLTMAQIQPNYDSETQALGIVGSQVRPRSMMSDYNVDDEDIFEDQIQHRTDQAIIREFEDKARCSKI